MENEEEIGSKWEKGWSCALRLSSNGLIQVMAPCHSLFVCELTVLEQHADPPRIASF